MSNKNKRVPIKPGAQFGFVSGGTYYGWAMPAGLHGVFNMTPRGVSIRVFAEDGERLVMTFHAPASMVRPPLED